MTGLPRGACKMRKFSAFLLFFYARAAAVLQLAFGLAKFCSEGPVRIFVLGRYVEDVNMDTYDTKLQVTVN